MFTFVLWPPIILKILFDLKTNPNDIGSPETVSKHSLNLSPVLGIYMLYLHKKIYSAQNILSKS